MVTVKGGISVYVDDIHLTIASEENMVNLPAFYMSSLFHKLNKTKAT